MALDLKSNETLLRDQATAIQAKSKALVDLSVGAILRAILESNAMQTLWQQGEIQKVLAATRAYTSTGTDLDTFVQDFGLTRLPAVAAVGNVTFSRFTATLQAVVPFSAKVETANGAQVFSVVIDPSHPNYSESLGGYVLPAGTASLSVPVHADVPGAAGNVGIGEINTILQGIPSIDTVTNTTAFASGQDVESDEALRSRFIDYLGGLAKASVQAIKSAIENVQNGLEYVIIEHIDYATGAARKGYFYVVVDDKSGSPSAQLLGDVTNAVDATRACGIRFEVHPPIIDTVTITLTITKAPGYGSTEVKAAVEKAITDYVNDLNMGDTLRYSYIWAYAKNASAGVLDIANVLINGATSNITIPTKEAFQPIVTATVI